MFTPDTVSGEMDTGILKIMYCTNSSDSDQYLSKEMYLKFI